MIGNKVSLLQKQKLDLQVQLDSLLHSSNIDYEEVSALKAEIKKINSDIQKIVGKNEIERRNELKNKQSGIDRINENNYYYFKSRVEQINPINLATSRMMGVISILEKRQAEDERVKVKAA